MSKRVLVAPLDWGLGHTSRCIPLIEELLAQGFQMVFAGTQQQYAFITQHNLNIKYVELFGYDVKYSAIFPQWIKIAAQFNKLKKTVNKEHLWLSQFLKKEKIDLVISDNRYGLYSKDVHSIFIGHQLNIQSPLFEKKINHLNARYINHFNECWIPDDEKLNLTGALSSNYNITIPQKKIGILSRFKKQEKSDEIKYDILLLLSGNEPQRSLLEEKLLQELTNTDYKIVLVRGTASAQKITQKNITVYDIVNAELLEQLISSSVTIICRSGYSSIMDLVNFTKKIIFVPTPGQTEQEYLAKHLKKTKNIAFVEQNKLSTLTQVIANCEITNFEYANQALKIDIALHAI